MAKQIGSLGVTVSANTLALQSGFTTASKAVDNFRNNVNRSAKETAAVAAGVRQFSATARIAAGVASSFDNAMLRLGTDTANFATSMRLAAPAMTAAFAGMAGILVGLIANFKELKAGAISAAESITDYFTRSKDVGLDLQGNKPSMGPSMSVSIARQRAHEANETSFTRGEIGRQQFLETKSRIDGASGFESQQLAASQIANEQAQEDKKIAEDQANHRIKMFRDASEAEANMRRRNMIAAKEAQDAFIAWEHEKKKAADDTAAAHRDSAQAALVGAGKARASQFETDPTKRVLMNFQERIDALRAGEEVGASFGITSGTFRGNAPTGMVIGEQREQKEMVVHLQRIEELTEKMVSFIEANGLGGVTIR